MIGARSLWNGGYRGQGIDVALIDSGTVPVQGLGAGKVIDGPDLSFERGNATLRARDTFGHGTHMAGLIAGAADSVGTNGAPPLGVWSGIAPSSRVISLKAATADGAADVSQVIAAVNWVVEHRRDPGLNIRVLNLSFGTNSAQSYLLDPLARAVEQAWKAGIVVIAAAGNDGPTATRLDNPATDPFVLAVGADNPGTDPSVRKDAVAEFSSRGSTTRHADLLAPGTSVLGLRDPGSALDLAYPGAVVGDRFFKGSGTSQAAAVTSGAVALLLSKRPTLTPDQVKKLLTSTAAPISGADAVSQGAGVLDVNKAAIAATPAISVQPFVASTGLGSLEAARGGAHVQRQGPHRRARRLRQGLDGHHLGGRHRGRDDLDGRGRRLGQPLHHLGVHGQLAGRHRHQRQHHLLWGLDRADVVRTDVVGRHLVLDPVVGPHVVQHPLVTATQGQRAGACCPRPVTVWLGAS